MPIPSVWTIISENAPYYTVQVKFNGCDFEQTIICTETGDKLTAAIDKYAAEYAEARHELPKTVGE